MFIRDDRRVIVDGDGVIKISMIGGQLKKIIKLDVLIYWKLLSWQYKTTVSSNIKLKRAISWISLAYFMVISCYTKCI